MNYKRVFLVVLLFKTIWFLLLAHAFYKNKPSKGKEVINYIVAPSNDMGSYIVPIENWVDYGEYYTKSESDANKIYTNRLPGLLPIYAPLYYLFGREWGMTFFIVVQFILDIISALLLTSLVYNLSFSKLFAWTTAIIYSVSCYVSLYVHYPISELICTFFIVSSFYFFFKYVRKRINKYLLIAGICVTWATFIRPASGVLLVVYALYIAYGFLRSPDGVKKTLVSSLYFILPFLVVECLWVTRNYVKSNRLIFLDTSGEVFLSDSPQTKAMFRLVSAIGGDIQRWIPESESNWFLSEQSTLYNHKNKDRFPFPDCMFSSGNITKEMIVDLRHSLISIDTIDNINTKKEHIDNFIEEADRITITFVNENPFYYYIIAPFKLVKKFLFIKRPYNYPFITSSLYDKAMRFLVLGLYYMVLLSAIIGMILLPKESRRSYILMFLFVVIHVAVYAIVFRLTENRYIVEAFPLVIVFASVFWHKLLERTNFKRNKY